MILPMFLPVDAPLKNTSEVDFDAQLKPLLKEGKEDDVKELIAALTSTRRQVLWALEDRTTVTTDDLLTRVADYARLLRGFVVPPEGGTGTLRHAISFVWRDLLDVKGRDWEMTDVALEEASVLLAAAQNLLSRVAREHLTSVNAIDIHSTLRRTAGILAEARRLATEAEAVVFVDNATLDAAVVDNVTLVDDAEKTDDAQEAKIVSTPEKIKDDKKKKDDKEKTKSPGQTTLAHRSSTDLRLALPEAWAALALAEAQTATLSRACTQAHIEWSLIGGLCADQVDRYGRGVDGHVEALHKAAPDAANIKEWAGKRVSHAFLKAHVDLKTLYFSALARYCIGAPLLEKAIAETDENTNSQALAELGEALKLMKDAQSAATRFVTTSRPLTYVQDPALPLQEAAALLKTAFDRAHQLDASIFHRGPSQLGPFPDPKSLISAVPAPDPGRSHLWTLAAWNAIDQSKLPDDPTFGVASDSRDCCILS